MIDIDNLLQIDTNKSPQVVEPYVFKEQDLNNGAFLDALHRNNVTSSEYSKFLKCIYTSMNTYMVDISKVCFQYRHLDSEHCISKIYELLNEYYINNTMDTLTFSSNMTVIDPRSASGRDILNILWNDLSLLDYILKPDYVDMDHETPLIFLSVLEWWPSMLSNISGLSSILDNKALATYVLSNIHSFYTDEHTANEPFLFN